MSPSLILSITLCCTISFYPSSPPPSFPTPSLSLIDNVEMEIVLPGSMTVVEYHDIALALQHKIEAMVDMERAFVHVDHQERDAGVAEQ